MLNLTFFEDSSNGVVGEKNLKNLTHLLICRLWRNTYIADYTSIDSGIMFRGSIRVYNAMVIFLNKVEFNGI